MSGVVDAFAAKNSGAEIFVRERTGGVAMLAVSPRRVVLSAAGPIHSEHIVGVLEDAHVGDLLGSDEFNALIDISAYTGSVDWSDIRKVKDVMPKGDCRTNRNAYVVRNDFFAMIAKITAALFAQTECRAFKNEGEARKWLGWE